MAKVKEKALACCLLLDEFWTEFPGKRSAMKIGDQRTASAENIRKCRLKITCHLSDGVHAGKRRENYLDVEMSNNVGDMNIDKVMPDTQPTRRIGTVSSSM